MTQKIGMIHLRGAGDNIIVLPIAKYWHDQGLEVHWVIDDNFYEAFKYAAPYVHFHPLKEEESKLHTNIRNPFWYENPKKILTAVGVDEIVSFPFEELKHVDKIGIESRLVDPLSVRARAFKFANFLKFDQFKYALANVPFKEKWNLDIRRNIPREREFYDKIVGGDEPYILAHLQGAMGNINFELDKERFAKEIGMSGVRFIDITPMSDSVFDWLSIIERCSCFVGLDSFYVNLIEQLKIPIRKYFIRRSPIEFTPVLLENWQYIPVELSTDKPFSYSF